MPDWFECHIIEIHVNTKTSFHIQNAIKYIYKPLYIVEIGVMIILMGYVFYIWVSFRKAIGPIALSVF